MDRELNDADSAERWHNLYIEIRNQSHECSYRVAKYPENRNLNRYRDVSPYDHSRVKLKNSENDYINASLIVMDEVQRSYILTQGPLRNTCGHFWLMIWEQRTKAVIMLNRIMEKGSEKCAQYWPSAQECEMSFQDTNFTVKLISEDVKSYYTIRVLELQNMATGESREIYHFHYTTWPDFGVPESPASFLNFLFKVRESGSLETEYGPSVVHCSAGIGRSGTFSLVDTCLVLMEKRKDPSTVDIQKVLLDMRRYRMGLIQTPDQLRFSYMAVKEGSQYITGDRSVQVSVQQQWQELSKEDEEPELEAESPQLVPPRPVSRANGSQETPSRPGERPEEWPTGKDAPQPGDWNAKSLRRRTREERRAGTTERVQQIKQRLSDTEQRRKRWLYWKPVVLAAGAGVALAVGLYAVWGLLSQ